MRDLNLKCHYCGAKVEIDENECTGEFFTRCMNMDCDATGPCCPTPELAAAAHATVTPAMRWASEPPKVPGAWWVQSYADGRVLGPAGVREVDENAIANYAEWQAKGTLCARFAGPIPLPLEPGKGGGA